jgi:hypothetical protein
MDNILDLFRKPLSNHGITSANYTINGNPKVRVIKYKVKNELYVNRRIDDDFVFSTFFLGLFIIGGIMLFWLIPNMAWSNVLFHLGVCCSVILLWESADTYKEAIEGCAVWICFAMLAIGIMGWISVYGDQSSESVAKIARNINLIYPSWLFKFTFV